MPSQKWEKFFQSLGIEFVAGIDEVGRGPLAGPVVAAAVILPVDAKLRGLNDSKKLNQKEKNRLFKRIKKVATSIGVGIVDHEIIDQINIAQATFAAMRLAVESLDQTPGVLLIDGNCEIHSSIPQKCIIKGDSKCSSIAAASIIAKVIRDKIMIEFDKVMPEYGFKKHKGYGTKLHMERLENHGLSTIHRRTFISLSKKTLDYEQTSLINSI